ncbi:efflux RND transporter periplasmic adaptor subunit [Flavobacterium agricola]|uniref:Efflux RND transporter periplasmic adaptor subunit n=1 Tax=Flavobacterium agricola TaxID=2870839 RepID=A0ABY6LY61_9FLAO|nr:efflux RND transporter periplasmic adaptor subunit [Flavobacterium agricola]UYW00324.1 efflux RND transporter periplasmic adaptor subunit [Flavobacterium agricola]
MKNKVINALLGVFVILVILGVSLWYMSAPSVAYLQGQVEATQINVASKIPGRIEQILVKEGDVVENDQLLAVISTPEIDAQLAQVEAVRTAAEALNKKVDAGARSQEILATYNLWQQAKAASELAKKTYDRIENLYKEKVVPAQQRDQAYTQYQVALNAESAAHANYDMVKSGARSEDKVAAKAQVSQAQDVVNAVNILKSEGHVKAPRKGEVLTIMPNSGEIVNMGYPIINLVDLEDIWVNFNVKEVLLSKFKMGTKFKAMIPGLDNQVFEFEVKYVAAQGNYATWNATKSLGDFDMKTFLIKAYPVTKIDGLRPGMSALVNEADLK